MQLQVNLFCRDIDAQLAFYMSVLAAPEAVAARSPIFRAVAMPHAQLGLHAPAAYALLELADRACTTPTPPVTAYATFMLATPGEVTLACERALMAGAHRVKGPYATYYGQWQVVLADPEGHVFRLSAVGLPAGQTAPALG
jgi:uncharacterized glyoxalase superfamily protein PhnB